MVTGRGRRDLKRREADRSAAAGAHLRVRRAEIRSAGLMGRERENRRPAGSRFLR